MHLLSKQLFLFCLMIVVNQSTVANSNSDCSCWKVIGWQQDQTQIILGNVPILQAARCHESYPDRVWVQVTIGSNPTDSYWLSLSKQDKFVSLYTHPLTGQQSYRFAPLLVLGTPPSGITPPEVQVNALPCVNCPNHIMAQTTCPCPDPRVGCFPGFTPQKPVDINPIIIGNPTPVNPPTPPRKRKKGVFDF